MKRIVKIIRYQDKWVWEGVLPSRNINEAVRDCERLAHCQYPSASLVLVIPIFMN